MSRNPVLKGYSADLRVFMSPLMSPPLRTMKFQDNLDSLLLLSTVAVAVSAMLVLVLVFSLSLDLFWI